MHTSKRPRHNGATESPLTGPGGAPLQSRTGGEGIAGVGPVHENILLQYMFIPHHFTPQQSGIRDRTAEPGSAPACAAAVETERPDPDFAPASAAVHPGGNNTLAEEEEDVACTGERTWEERDAELRQNAIVIDDTPIRGNLAPEAEGKPFNAVDQQTPQEDDVHCTGERSWEERDAELRRCAIVLDDSPAGGAASSAAGSSPGVPAGAGAPANPSSAAASSATPTDPLTAARVRMETPPVGYKPPMSFSRLWNKVHRGLPESDGYEPPPGAELHVDAIREAWYASTALGGGWPDAPAPASTTPEGCVTREGFAAFLYAVQKRPPTRMSKPPVGYIAVAHRDSLWGAGSSFHLPSAEDASAAVKAEQAEQQ